MTLEVFRASRGEPFVQRPIFLTRVFVTNNERKIPEIILQFLQVIWGRLLLKLVLGKQMVDRILDCSSTSLIVEKGQSEKACVIAVSGAEHVLDCVLSWIAHLEREVRVLCDAE
jgi:hypothetical protein